MYSKINIQLRDKREKCIYKRNRNDETRMRFRMCNDWNEGTTVATRK